MIKATFAAPTSQCNTVCKIHIKSLTLLDSSLKSKYCTWKYSVNHILQDTILPFTANIVNILSDHVEILSDHHHTWYLIISVIGFQFV
jgi:hypothetical protein